MNWIYWFYWWHKLSRIVWTQLNSTYWVNLSLSLCLSALLFFLPFFIRYLAHLHFQCYPKSPPYPPPTPLPPTPTFWHWRSLYWGIYSSQVQWASLSSNGRLGHLLIHMQLESRAPGYWLVHNVVTPVGLQIPLAPWVLSLPPPLGAMWSIQ